MELLPQIFRISHDTSVQLMFDKLVKPATSHVRYLRSAFEYFWNRFASIPVPTKPMMVPDRSRRALSIAHLNFFRRPPLHGEKPQITVLKRPQIVKFQVKVVPIRSGVGTNKFDDGTR